MYNVLKNRNMIAAVVVCGFCAVKVIQAFNPQPDPPGFALIGVTPVNEFARLNVSNVAIPGISLGGSCDVELSFGDGQGRTLKSAMVTLAQGKSASLDVTATDIRATASDLAVAPRVELLPAVQRGGNCLLNSSVEVVATATGQTSAYAAHASLTLNHNETLVRDTESQ
ncbi:exported hypothetical protein [Candidatus Sulfopaludibacter sp. SbA3]|nr:exported hypothetical protein [Candidatus Sulfopaludibacter sp. SbA3]